MHSYMLSTTITVQKFKDAKNNNTCTSKLLPVS